MPLVVFNLLQLKTAVLCIEIKPNVSNKLDKTELLKYILIYSSLYQTGWKENKAESKNNGNRMVKAQRTTFVYLFYNIRGNDRFTLAAKRT